MLFHGTTKENLRIIKANSLSHASGKAVAYFTEDRCYALVCCLDKSENFVTVGIREDGKQHYFERFPNQLKILYEGKRGFVYSCKKNESFKNTRFRTWESETDVAVSQCEKVNDVYTELLQEEQKGNIVLHRYEDIDINEQKMHARYIKEHLEEESSAMKQFYIRHFSSLWD